MLYTKFFITEGVIANILNSDYYPVILNGGLSLFIQSITNELDLNREEFTQTYDLFSSNELCKEYKYFMKNTTINITTLSANREDNIPLLFNGAMTRIPAAINDLVHFPELLNMKNRDTYELMFNLINEYYINWDKVIQILFNDCIKVTKFKQPVMIIILIHFVVSIISLFLFLKLLSKFS